jgi:hypothetical protein
LDAIVARDRNMTQAMLLTRFYRLPRERRNMLLSALVTLTAASATVALLPFRMAIAFGSIPLGTGGRVNPEECVWAVEAAARRLPWRTMCIEKGLAAQRMLRSAGTDALLHYGAHHAEPSGKLEAHVWVSVAGEIVIGGEEAPHFAEIASYP